MVMAVCMGMFMGCDMTPQQRVAYYQSAAAATQEFISELDKAIYAVQVLIADGETMLKDPKVDIGDKADIQAKIEKGKEQLAALLEKKEEAKKTVDVFKQQIDDVLAKGEVTIDDEAKLVGGGIQQVAPFIPGKAGAVVYLIGGAIMTFGGLIGKSWQKIADAIEIAKLKKQQKAIIDSVSVGLDKLPDESAKTMKDEMKIAQAKSGVRGVVDSLRNTPSMMV